MLFCYADAIQHVLDVVGSETSLNERRFARIAIQQALRDLGNVTRWNYYTTVGRIATHAPYNTGTIAYTESTRTVTLSGGTFPSWANYGTLLIGKVLYEVFSMPTSTTLVLASNTTPGADLLAGTAYQLFQGTYRLPADFKSLDKIYVLETNFQLDYIPANEWLTQTRFFRTPSLPICFTVTGDPRAQNYKALRISYAPSEAQNLDFIYQRRPRAIRYEIYNTGVVTLTNNSATVTGSGTFWSTNMIGSIFRTGTGDQGAAPTPDTERVVQNVTDTGTLTLNAVYTGDTIIGTNYVISDPVDVDEGAMLNLFLSLCLWRARSARGSTRVTEALAQVQEDTLTALAANSAYHGQDVAGSGRDGHGGGYYGWGQQWPIGNA